MTTTFNLVNHIHHGNCIDFIQNIPDDYVDTTITSPPYNMMLRAQGEKYVPRKNSAFATKYSTFTDNLPIEQFYQFHSRMINQMLRITKNQVFYNFAIVTGSKRAFFRILGEYSEYIKEVFVWNKLREQPAINHGVINRRTELIVVFAKTDAIHRAFHTANFDRGTMSDLINITPDRHPNHGASYPIALMEHLILNFTQPNDIIFDPFMGTGTTAVAAAQLHRRYLGCELDETYIEYAQSRLSKIQLSLF